MEQGYVMNWDKKISLDRPDIVWLIPSKNYIYVNTKQIHKL